VVFDPQYKESLASSPPFTVLNNPTVYLIFWGTDWGSGKKLGPSAVTELTNDATAVLNTFYFSKTLAHVWGTST
jgi:hypothetical protein